MGTIEKLDILNIFEIQRIRALLVDEPDLLSMFEILVIMCNTRLNSEEKLPDKKIVLEDNIEPDLSSDSEDDLQLED